jgi:hypothetical protein
VLAGLIVARVLPYVYPVLDPLLSLVFGSGPSSLRDGFNARAMTAITFIISFTLAFATSAPFLRRRGA